MEQANERLARPCFSHFPTCAPDRLMGFLKSKGKKLIGYPSKDDPRVVSSTAWIDHVKAGIDVSSRCPSPPLKLRGTHSLSAT